MLWYGFSAVAVSVVVFVCPTARPSCSRINQSRVISPSTQPPRTLFRSAVGSFQRAPTEFRGHSLGSFHGPDVVRGGGEGAILQGLPFRIYCPSPPHG
ncbi:hypothetical protein BD289DRAFT_438020 [Coniella lustricola]|uniref:Secreted protein n=1 Tax=Coniella lustricola TaxID=2025994 RepID=A0A2T3A3F8_9PEZI|nr:hypothetical protein BD289DRAFT_438020 [Coniella lustricola]